MSPQNCPEGYWYNCEECRNHFEGRCYSGESRPIIDILTDTERIARLEAQSTKPQPTPRAEVQHLQAQIDHLERKYNELAARKKKYARF